MHPTYPNLFSPLKLGPYTLRNRIVATAMTADRLDAEGHMTADTYAFFEAFAAGGASVVTIGNTLVHNATGNNHGRVLKLDDPSVITSLINLSDRIKEHGALASIQLLHAGRRADPKFTEGGRVYGPSGGVCHYGDTHHAVTELDEGMIDRIVNAYGDAAELAMLGGFQMCQVHGGHGWLINQFLSPANNQRKDRFGGSIENRCRFARLVVENVRKKCGPNFPIEFRLSGEDFMENGATLADTLALAEMLDGKVDAIQVSAASFHNPKACLRMFPNMFLPRGCNAYLAAEIKKRVSVPVITVGGFNDPAHMERALSEGQADVIALGRALTIDPELPNKIRTGREGDIIYCLRCGLCNSSDFVPYVKYALGVNRCAVNPWADRPAEAKLRGLFHGKQKVLVAGGGPGGMQAALGAAENGNRVVLCEKTGSLGGALRYAWQPSFKRDIKRYVAVLERRIRASGNIELRLNTPVTPALLEAEAPDTVIFAIGAEPIVPSIPGIGDSRVLRCIDMGENRDALGRQIVVIGGGLVGCEEGLDLAMRGKEVTVLEMRERFAADAPYMSWLMLSEQMGKTPGLSVKLRHTCLRVVPEGVAAADEKGAEHIFPADTIILAAGMRPLTKELEALRAATSANVIVVGDCLKPANMYEAGYHGYFAGYGLR